MLKKFFSGKPSLFLVDAAGKLKVMLDPASDPPRLRVEGNGLVPDPAHPNDPDALHPFLELRKRGRAALRGEWDTRTGSLCLQLELSDPARRCRLEVNPTRGTFRCEEQLSEAVDGRIPQMAPYWSFKLPPAGWPLKPRRNNLSAVFYRGGVLAVVGDRLFSLDRSTGHVVGEWDLPLPEPGGVAMAFLMPIGKSVLGTYRSFEGGYPRASGLFLLKLEERPRWKLFPGGESRSAGEPLEDSDQRRVVETRIYAGEDYIPSRAQYVLDLVTNRSYTAVLGGPPQDDQWERALSLQADNPNELLFEPTPARFVGYNPTRKLLASPTLPRARREPPQVLRRGALWSGRALAYEATPGSVTLHSWVHIALEWARCVDCGLELPRFAYRCRCGYVHQPGLPL